MSDPLNLPARGENATIEHASWRQRVVIEPPSADVVRGRVTPFQIGRIDTQASIRPSEARELATVLFAAADEVERRNAHVLPKADAYVAAVRSLTERAPSR